MPEFLNLIQPEAFIGNVLETSIKPIKDTKVRIQLTSFISREIWKNLVDFGKENNWRFTGQNQGKAKSMFRNILQPKIVELHCADMNTAVTKRVAPKITDDIITNLYKELCNKNQQANKAKHQAGSGSSGPGGGAGGGKKSSGGRASQVRSRRGKPW